MKLKIIHPYDESPDPAFQTEDCKLLQKIYGEYYPKVGFEIPWVGYYMLHEEEVVGSCGFTSPPVDGVVEIAYWTFTPFEGKGMASEACKLLVSLALQTNAALRIVAKTAPMKNASTRILEKNNFAFDTIVTDHEIGDAWLWVYQK